MAETSTTSIGMNKFSTYLLYGLGGFSFLGSFFEQDERGILFSQDPEVFAVSEVPATVPFTEGVGTGSSFVFNEVGASAPGQPRGTARFTGPRSRLITGNAPQSAPGAGVAGPSAVAPFSNLAPVNTVPVAPSGALVPANGGTNAVGGGAPQNNGLQSITPLGQGTGPIGSGATPISIVAPDPAAPAAPVVGVVATVPEPASWLLMILGIGALGAALRLQFRRKNSFLHA